MNDASNKYNQLTQLKSTGETQRRAAAVENDDDAGATAANDDYVMFPFIIHSNSLHE